MKNSNIADDKIVIGLCTFNRNEQLKEALDSLSKINVPDNVEVAFVLVDNDKDGKAKYVFDAYLADLPFPGFYFIEKNRGLSNARNRILEAAIELNASMVAMFDDDEIVTQSWLMELYSVLKNSQADGVVGTVCRLLPIDSSKFIKSLWGNNKVREPAVDMLGTNNCLFLSKIIRSDGWNIRFDPEFNFSGREDLVFSFDARLKGAKFVPAPEAIVIEKFPKERATFGYLLNRWFELGVTDVVIAKRYGFPIVTRTLKEIVSILLRVIFLPFACFRGPRKLAKHILITAAICGWICGIMFNKKADHYLRR